MNTENLTKTVYCGILSYTNIKKGEILYDR